MFKLIGVVEGYSFGVSKKTGNPWASLKVKSKYINNFGDLVTNDYEIFCPEGWQSFENMLFATVELPCSIYFDFKKEALKVQGISDDKNKPRVIKEPPQGEKEFLDMQLKNYREMMAVRKGKEEADKVSTKAA